MRPVTLNTDNVHAALKEIEQASHQADTTEMAQNFTFNAPVTTTTALNVSAPTIANTNLVLATLLQILQRGGLNTST